MPRYEQRTALRLTPETIDRLRRLTRRLNAKTDSDHTWPDLARLLVEKGLTALEKKAGLAGGEKWAAQPLPPPNYVRSLPVHTCSATTRAGSGLPAQSAGCRRTAPGHPGTVA